MSRDFQRIANLIDYINTHSEEQPKLEALAAQAQLSPFHLQKLFTRWAGVSPKQYLKLATLNRAKHYLIDNFSVLEASHKSGLSSASRLYDHFVSIEGVTPGEFKTAGDDLTLYFGFGESEYGNTFIVWTERGLHKLLFTNDPNASTKALKREWPLAKLQEDSRKAQSLLQTVISPSKMNTPTPLSPIGTNFQINVWKALLSIPEGYCVSYGDIATLLGKPSAARAVGSAVGANPLAVLIPCHRVIQQSGTVGHYRWGEKRKKIILAREFCLRQREKNEKEII